MTDSIADLSSFAGTRFSPTTFTYDERDAMRYALGVGAAPDPLDPIGLSYAYENAAGGFQVLPTFAATFGYGAMWQILDVPGLNLNAMKLLHGEQETRVPRPLPPRASVSNHGAISHVYDKGSGALFLVDVTSTTQEGTILAENRYSLFVRGLGGWGGERGPAAGEDVPADAPDAVYEQATAPSQALLYRLSGDYNPLHVDTRVAALAGYDRPILHGLATYGFAAHVLLRQVTGGLVAPFRRMRARFAGHVFPGEPLITELWQPDAGNVLFRCRVAGREAIALSHGHLQLEREA
jgi:(3R)-3-hydroxyacyl-CoA dehydrogenase / 3a,7a,12a-trihydroxy-5b-cholest-24-enoyl-CoA hydratase / enoyl-CoA hydratase 2